MIGSTYLDTNIFIKAFEDRDALSARLAELFVLETPLGHQAFSTCELTLAELLVKPFRDQDVIRIQRYEDLLTSSAWLQVGPVDRQVLAAAALIRTEFRLKLPDAIHLSAAMHFRCRYFLSDDHGLDGTYQLDFRTPSVSWNSEPIEIIRPDAPGLDLITKSIQA